MDTCDERCPGSSRAAILQLLCVDGQLGVHGESNGDIFAIMRCSRAENYLNTKFSEELTSSFPTVRREPHGRRKNIGGADIDGPLLPTVWEHTE
jgi:hypothetical protein